MTDFRNSNENLCCIAGCNRIGQRTDRQGRLYCHQCWQEHVKEDSPCEDCNGCEQKCAVPDCGKVGVVLQQGTGKWFCADHAYKADRPIDESEIKWTDDDLKFLKAITSACPTPKS